MATPRKRKRPENESQDIDETYLDQDIEASQANSNAGGSGQIDASQFSGSPKRSHHGLGGVSSQIQLTPKKKMKLLNDNSNDETAHQYQTSLPINNQEKNTPAGTPAKKYQLQANKSLPKASFITSSPMSKKNLAAEPHAKKPIALSRSVRRLSDEFEAIDAEESRKAPVLDELNKSQAAQATSSSSSAASLTDSKPADYSSITIQTSHGSKNGSSTFVIHNNNHPDGTDSAGNPVYHRPSLNHPHADQSDQHNTSLMETIFSPGLRNFVSQKFHAITSSLLPNSESNRLSSSLDIPRTSSRPLLQSSLDENAFLLLASDKSDKQSVSLVSPANGVHHAAYRKPRNINNLTSSSMPNMHHGLTSNSSDNSISRLDLDLQSGNVDLDTSTPQLTQNSETSESQRESTDASENSRRFLRYPNQFQNIPKMDEEEYLNEATSPFVTTKLFESVQTEISIPDDTSDNLEYATDQATDEIEVEADEELEEVSEVSEEEFDSYFFISRVPPLSDLHSRSPPVPRLPLKPRNCKKVTLVLDLDETLVHCSLEKIDNPDLIFTVPFEGEEYEVYVRKRPGFDQFLDAVSEQFEVAVFTASQQAYADKLLSILDPTQKRIQHRLFRDSCVYVLGNYLKDLTVLGRDLSKVVIVDNSPHVFAYQLDNGVPIESWFNDNRDRQLLHLLPFLESLTSVDDVRPAIRQKFQLHKKVEESVKAYNQLTRFQLEAATDFVATDDEEEEEETSLSARNPKKSGNTSIAQKQHSSLTETESDEEEMNQKKRKFSRRKARTKSRIPVLQTEDSDVDN